MRKSEKSQLTIKQAVILILCFILSFSFYDLEKKKHLCFDEKHTTHCLSKLYDAYSERVRSHQAL